MLFCGCCLVLLLFCCVAVIVTVVVVVVVVVVDFVLVVVVSTTITTTIFASTNNLIRQRTNYIAQSTLLAGFTFTSTSYNLSCHAVTLSVHKTIHPGFTPD